MIRTLTVGGSVGLKSRMYEVAQSIFWVSVLFRDDSAAGFRAVSVLSSPHWSEEETESVEVDVVDERAARILGVFSPC